VKADPFYPSTKKCSGCGHVKEEMRLGERTYSCEACRLVMDRDLNASRNLATVAASSAETENACGGIDPHRASGEPSLGNRNPASSVFITDV
jgi:putative transposase